MYQKYRQIVGFCQILSSNIQSFSVAFFDKNVIDVLMTLFQSPLRKTISQEIYKKSLFEVSIEGKPYRGVAKFMKRFGARTARYMVHGVEFSNTDAFSPDLAESIARLKRDLNHHWWDIFVQLGITNILDARPTADVKIAENSQEITKKHMYQASDLLQRYSMRPSWREHMPQATIIFDLSQPVQYILDGFSTSGKRFLKKAEKEDLSFEIASNPSDREAFYRIRYTMSFDKDFNIISLETFMQLMNYLESTHQGALFLCKKNWAIVSGSLCLFLGASLIYLYGATNRQWGDIWWHYWLTTKIIEWAHDQHVYTSFDLLGVSAARDHEHHHLQWVTRFKQAFGGTTVSYVGNYDIIFNPLLYTWFSRWKKK